MCTLSKPLLVRLFLPAYIADKWKMLLDTMPGKGLDLTKPRSPRTNACGQRLRFAAEALDVDTRSITPPLCVQLVLSNKTYRLGVKKNKKEEKEQCTRWRKHKAKEWADWKKVCGFWLAGWCDKEWPNAEFKVFLTRFPTTRDPWPRNIAFL